MAEGKDCGLVPVCSGAAACCWGSAWPEPRSPGGAGSSGLARGGDLRCHCDG